MFCGWISGWICMSRAASKGSGLFLPEQRNHLQQSTTHSQLQNQSTYTSSLITHLISITPNWCFLMETNASSFSLKVQAHTIHIPAVESRALVLSSMGGLRGWRGRTVVYKGSNHSKEIRLIVVLVSICHPARGYSIRRLVSLHTIINSQTGGGRVQGAGGLFTVRCVCF